MRQFPPVANQRTIVIASKEQLRSNKHDPAIAGGRSGMRQFEPNFAVPEFLRVPLPSLSVSQAGEFSVFGDTHD